MASHSPMHLGHQAVLFGTGYKTVILISYLIKLSLCKQVTPFHQVTLS